MTDEIKIEEQIDETVEEMKKKIDEISKGADEVDGDLQDKAKEVKEKSVEVLNKAIDKLKELYSQATDPEEVKKTLDFVKTKAKELSDGANKAFEDLKEKEKVKKASGKSLQQAIPQPHSCPSTSPSALFPCCMPQTWMSDWYRKPLAPSFWNIPTEKRYLFR